MSANVEPVAALIRTRDSAATLPKCLRGLAVQRPPLAEVIIVDNGSKDRTLEIARNYGCRIISYPGDREFNYSAALNQGIADIQTGEILILSSHTVLCFSDIVRRLSECLGHYNACGSYCTTVQKNEIHRNIRSPHRGRIVPACAASFNGFNGLSNTCSLIRRADWEARPFDETMPAAEDQEWAWWHMTHRNAVTVCLHEMGVLYLNPKPLREKQARDYCIIAERMKPEWKNWSNILQMTGLSIRHLALGRSHLAADLFARARSLVLLRAGKKFHSRY